MEFFYKKVDIKDLDILIKTRIEILKVINHLDETADIKKLKTQIEDYYKNSLADGTHTAYIIFDGEKFIGTGGISYYRVMPSYHNQTGKTAFIMNVYVSPDYRKKGIVKKILDLLVSDAEEKGISCITLDTTKMGRPLYEKYGFINIKDYMELKNKLF